MKKEKNLQEKKKMNLLVQSSHWDQVPREDVKQPFETKRFEMKKVAKPKIKKEEKRSNIANYFDKQAAKNLKLRK